MRHIFIIGSRGYHYNYGGWETFVSNLVDNYNDSNTCFYISEYTNDKKRGIRKINDNVVIFPIYVPNYKSATMFIYTIKSFKYFVKYISDNNIKNSYMYVLGLKLFNYLKLYRNKLRRLNVTTVVNPDGLEHERSKWGSLVKKFFLFSEKLMLNNCDMIICDALGIKKYIVGKYPKLENKTTYIAYGSDSYDFSDIDEKKILDEYSLISDDYCLMVGRCVPENNYELVIRDFMRSNIDKKLVIITNLSSSSYYEKLINDTNCLDDKRIKFIDGVYDREKLAVIRRNAYLYIHGHSVGGTNPSLIEALSLTNLNLLYEVCFNRDVGEDSCLYFKESGDLTKILDNESNFKNRDIYGRRAKKIVKNNFTWDIIVSKYKKVFK